MTLSIGSVAPDFTADTTQGPIHFHDWIGDSWAILFSHPKAFTPVCTTELGYMAGLKDEFAKRNTKIIGLSVDSSEDNNRWLPDIEEVGGNKVDYPVIGDSDLNVAKLYNMLPADAGDSAAGRTYVVRAEPGAADAETRIWIEDIKTGQRVDRDDKPEALPQ